MSEENIPTGAVGKGQGKPTTTHLRQEIASDERLLLYALFGALAKPERGVWRLNLIENHGRFTLRSDTESSQEVVRNAENLSAAQMIAYLDGLRFGQSYDWKWEG